MENAKINYIKIIEDLQAQFSSVLDIVKDCTYDSVTEKYINNHDSNIVFDKETYEELSVVKEIFVTDEQHFIKKKDLNSNNIYIAVKFGSATVNFASSVLSLTLRIIATENKIKPTQLILGDFVSRYNLNFLNGDKEITQVWYTPVVTSNFNPTNTAFRTLFSMSGIVVIGQNTLDLETVSYITDIQNEETGECIQEPVALMSFDEGYQASANPQPFYNTNGLAKTEINFGTNTISFSTYLLDSQLVADCMSARRMVSDGLGEHRSSEKGMNNVFRFKISYTNGFTNLVERKYVTSARYLVGELITHNNKIYKCIQAIASAPAVFNEDYWEFVGLNCEKYKLISFRISKKIGDIPSFVATFSY